MRPIRDAVAFAASAAMAGAALGAALLCGYLLQINAARSSNQQPAEDSWLEPATRTSPALVATGRRLFLASCAHCHGADASGDEGPDLHDLQVSDHYIARMIALGEPHEMPSFARKHGPADIAALTAYLRSLE